MDQIDWIHRGQSLNICFNALDRHVVHGRADEVAVTGERPLTYARLLEDVAAFGGVLRAFETGLGDTVVARLAPGRDALVALLASLRLGAVHTLAAMDGGPDDGTVTVLGLDDAPRATIRREGRPGEQDADWDLMLRAGRTDPAPCAEVPASAPALVVGDELVTTEQLLREREGWPYDALAALLAGRAVTLSR